MSTATHTSSKRSRIAVVGGGAAGVLTAAQLRRRRPEALITLIDASGRPGTGAAYGTPDPTHLLNVPAPRMSAWPDAPDQFSTWLDEHAVATFDGFAPRSAYGRYLLDVLHDADVRIECAEVVRLDPGPPSRLTLSDGRVLAADAVALATGRPPGTIPESLERALGPALLADARVVVDPWAPGALTDLASRKPARVLVIGSGLTGVDVALHLVARGSNVTLLSRHGEMPRRFRAVGPPTDTPNVLALPEHPTLDELRQAISADVAAARANGCDWRQVIDALRPHTASLWRSLGWADQRRFLREDLRAWEVLRHRMPPAVADAIDHARDAGALAVQAGELVDAQPGEELTLVVATADGSTRFHVDAVVVAAGTAWDRRALGQSPLWRNLLDRKIAALHPSGVGVRVHESGYLIDDAGGAVSGVVCIGAIRQGELWESTAIPEIRAQAAAIGEVLAEKQPAAASAVAHPAVRSPATAADAAYAEGVRRLLAVQQGASLAFAAAVAADPGHARGHAGLALISTERPDRAGGRAAVAGHVARARAAAARASEDDKSHVEAIAIWCERGNQEGTVALVRHLERVPDDELALIVLAPSIAFAGAGDALPDVWDYVERFAPIHGEVPWYLGLRAYGRTEQGRWYDAADLTEAAFDGDPTNGNAAHALAHVHYETDAHGAGLRWLEGWVDDEGRTQRYRPHFQWHAALHELAMGDAAAASRRYAAHLAPPRSDGVRCLVDAGSLTWRARINPDWVTPPDPLPVLAAAVDLATAPETAFVAFHAMLVLAAANDRDAIRTMRVPGASDLQAATLRYVGDGLVALLDGEPRAAVDQLLEALPGLPALGGSRVQQEVVLETALAAMLQLGAPGQAARLLSRHRATPMAAVARGVVS